MPIEVGILGGDDRLPEHRVDVVVADDDAPLRGELADQLIVGRVDARDGAGRVVVERGDLRQVAGVARTARRSGCRPVAATMNSATIPARRANRMTTCFISSILAVVREAALGDESR